MTQCKTPQGKINGVEIHEYLFEHSSRYRALEARLEDLETSSLPGLPSGCDIFKQIDRLVDETLMRGGIVPKSQIPAFHEAVNRLGGLAIPTQGIREPLEHPFDFVLYPPEGSPRLVLLVADENHITDYAQEHMADWESRFGPDFEVAFAYCKSTRWLLECPDRPGDPIALTTLLDGWS